MEEVSQQLSKRELAELVYAEVVPSAHAWGKDKSADHKLDTMLMQIFVQEVGLTDAGAQTYIRGCKRVAEGLPFYYGSPAGPRDTTPLDTSPDVEDERPLFSIVIPRDDNANKRVVVDSTHSFFDKLAAFATLRNMNMGDAIVVDGLPDLESNFFNLVPLKLEA